MWMRDAGSVGVRGVDLTVGVPMVVIYEVEWVPGTKPGLFNWATWIR